MPYSFKSIVELGGPALIGSNDGSSNLYPVEHFNVRFLIVKLIIFAMFLNILCT